MKGFSPRCLFATLAFTLASACVMAAPDGYSVNSDSGSADADSLYRIDLATGAHVRLGRVQSLGQTRLDVEGLGFAPDGTLYGVDDESGKLFPINIDNGAVVNQQEVNLTGLPVGGGNDFGMTFGCDGNLYLSSVNSDSLYRVTLAGAATRVGASDGLLGANISALAAWGNPVQLFGLGNGLTGGGAVDSRKLYSINTTTGVATVIGDLDSDALAYHEAGLAFDNAGTLWAITDRRAVAGGPFPSQLLTLNTATGKATAVSTTTEQGFESLAITVPRGCSSGGDRAARFTVQKRFVDDNDVTPVTLALNCNTGLPLQQSRTVQPNEGAFGEYEVEFVVESFDSGQLSCTVTETPPAGYTPSYTCLGESDCAAAQSPDSCVFTAVESGTENLCQVQNYPNPVAFTVDKQWVYPAAEPDYIETVRVDFECEHAFAGDGTVEGDAIHWSWEVKGNATNVAQVYPAFDGSTRCRATEHAYSSAVESDNGCADWTPVPFNAGALSCTIVNTVFFEGIPALGRFGLLLLAALTLGLGMVAARRF